MSHLFTIQVTGIDLSRDYEDALYEAGCDDALIAVIDDALDEPLVSNQVLGAAILIEGEL